jgi:hypothetical protein
VPKKIQEEWVAALASYDISQRWNVLATSVLRASETTDHISALLQLSALQYGIKRLLIA